MDNREKEGVKKEKRGISLRRLQFVLIVVTACVSFALLYYTYVSYRNYKYLSRATDEFLNLHAAAAGLLSASDYLTESAQRFTDAGELQYLDAYFEEAFVTRRRENALKEIGKYPECETAFEKLQNALDDSIELMNREYYSMRLVIEAKGYWDYPDVLRDVKLSEEDENLSNGEKMTLARKMLLDEEYYVKKDSIRTSMNEGQDELSKLSNINKEYLEELYQHDTKVTRILIIAQICAFLIDLFLTMHLGIVPLLRAVNDIQEDKKITLTGASEFRYLARAYNKMFDSHQANMRQLNYKASHDELTDAYNRAGYDVILSGIDLETTCFIILDIDNFKLFNDTMGHEIGDKVLRKVADTLKKHFRSIDYICRIGGDEFAVIVSGMERSRMYSLTEKIEAIENDLREPENDLPSITLSIGISHGTFAQSTEELFEQADKALYKTKENGKNGYSFYK